MNEGWLWLSILKTTASPSPMSMTPAFSPGPQITRSPLVGRVRSQTFDDLYEQCSLHIAAMMPVSVRFGVRPRIAQARSNSSPLRPSSAASSAVTLLPPVILRGVCHMQGPEPAFCIEPWKPLPRQRSGGVGRSAVVPDLGPGGAAEHEIGMAGAADIGRPAECRA